MISTTKKAIFILTNWIGLFLRCLKTNNATITRSTKLYKYIISMLTYTYN